MAVAVVNKKQTGSAPSGTLAITSATAGNLLVLFINESASIVNAPKPKDNISGETGWTVDTAEGHKAIYSSSLNSVWVATKVAVGGETTLEAAPGVGATLEGMTYFECSGTSSTMDAITAKNNNASSKSITTTAITTADAGDLLLAGVGVANESKTVEAWTASMTNVETVSTRCIGGSYIPGTTLSAVTFKANWETARASGALVVALKPEAAAAASGLSMIL